MIVIILFCSLAISSSASWMVMKKKKDKRLSRVVALGVNTVLLCVGTFYLHEMDVRYFQKRMDGVFGSLGIAVLLFFIPVLTFCNYIHLEYVGQKKGIVF